ncbi:MAG: hypothetical protein V4499_02690 [Pseudomonadota bacterium]
MHLILISVIRLLLALLSALALTLSPVAASAAAAAPAAMANCGMKGEMPAKPDHAKMDCCTPACQASSAAALLPISTEGADGVNHERAPLATIPAKELISFAPTGLDPPPRLPA